MWTSPLTYLLVIIEKIQCTIGTRLYAISSKLWSADDVDDQVEFDEFLLSIHHTQTDNVESADYLNVANHSKHDITITDNFQDTYTVDVTIQCGGPITPAAGNSRVFSLLFSV